MRRIVKGSKSYLEPMSNPQVSLSIPFGPLWFPVTIQLHDDGTVKNFTNHFLELPIGARKMQSPDWEEHTRYFEDFVAPLIHLAVPLIVNGYADSKQLAELNGLRGSASKPLRNLNGVEEEWSVLE